MDERKKVYIVSSGGYAYYGIHGIFSTREKAEAFMREHPAVALAGTFNEIEEHTLDPD